MSNPASRQPVDMRMTARQLASTVRQGRKITIQIFDEYPFSGYLCGWDDEDYFIIIPNGTVGKPPIKRLVPKHSIQFIDLHDEKTFFDEPDNELMNSVVQPFKDVINKQYFSSATGRPVSASSS